MRWEYHTETTYDLNDINGSDEFRELYQLVTNTFKQLGQEGWELVSVDNGIAYFKRAINEQEPGYFTPEYFDKINEMAMKQISQAIVEVPTKQSYDD